MPKSRDKMKPGTKKALIRRVKRAVKKSRRELGDEKFEKELERTIAFLEKIQTKLTPKPGPGGKPKTAQKTRKPGSATRRQPALKSQKARASKK
jgi:hypothetical protein